MNQTTIQMQSQQLQKDIEQCKRKSSQYSTIRFLLILGVLFFVVQANNHQSFLYLIALIILIVFLYIANIHRRLKDLLEIKETYLQVYEDIGKRRSEEWKQFEDMGSEFFDESMTTAYDLDLFGRSRLFQYLNTASTLKGRETLAQWLSSQATDADVILSRQNAVKEMIENESFLLEMNMLSKLFQRHAKKLKKKKMDTFLSFMEEEIPAYPVILNLLSYALPVITILAVIAVMFFQVSLSIALAAFTITLCMSMLCFMNNNAQLSYVESMHDLMKDYERMFACVSTQSFQSEACIQLQSKLQDAREGLTSLNRILGVVRIRSNSVLFMVVNGFLAIDFHCVRALRKWKQQYGNKVRIWLEAIGEMEAILSLGQLGICKDHICFGEVQRDGLQIRMVQARHPLINETKAVANSIDMEHGSYVITGSNMSGKTTFLRTIGINMILFQAGAPVVAQSFQASPLSIFTSMRVQDDVSEGISTFYAEILRIKQMMDASKKKEPMLVLIDEIFKGTNSADRILCAKEAIIKLHLPHVITMVSTHDFELCDLDKDAMIQAKNYHFSEYYEKDNICFDYQLKDGRCTTTNAKQLMKLAGF